MQLVYTLIGIVTLNLTKYGMHGNVLVDNVILQHYIAERRKAMYTIRAPNKITTTKQKTCNLWHHH